jgi:Zn-dependent M28 family amino/carboxypeptidase
LQASHGRTLLEVEQQIHRTARPASFELNGWRAELKTDVIRRIVEVPNIIAIREGSGPLAQEYVIVGAHYDHLGRGERGSTERDPTKKNDIHRGADDNGSGTVTVLELARRFAGRSDYQGRTLVFMTFAGEEQGLLGSRHWCNQPTLPLERVVAMVNFDMVGRLRPDKDSQKGKLEIGGVGTAKEFSTVLDRLNQRYDFSLAKTESGYGPSDHESFNEKKIPVLFFFTGLHPEYHKPADTVATINFDGMNKIVDFGTEVIDWLATAARPAFVQTKRPTPAGRVAVPRIGIMPGNYGDSDQGVLVAGVSQGGPAAKAGLKEGDVIIEIAGKPVKNMTAYMAVMGLQKKGAPVELVVERKGERVKVLVTPE